MNAKWEQNKMTKLGKKRKRKSKGFNCFRSGKIQARAGQRENFGFRRSSLPPSPFPRAPRAPPRPKTFPFPASRHAVLPFSRPRYKSRHSAPKPALTPFSFARPPAPPLSGLLLRACLLVAFAAAGEEAPQVNAATSFFLSPLGPVVSVRVDWLVRAGVWGMGVLR